MPGVDGSRARAGRGCRKREEKEGGCPVEIWRYARRTDDAAKYALSHTSRSHQRVARSANVLDDVADIANCKNYQRETPLAVSTPDFLTRANHARRPVSNSIPSWVIWTFLLARETATHRPRCRRSSSWRALCENLLDNISIYSAVKEEEEEH